MMEHIAAAIWAGVFPKKATEEQIKQYKLLHCNSDSKNEQWLWYLAKFGECSWCRNTGYILDGWDRKTSEICPMLNHPKHPNNKDKE